MKILARNAAFYSFSTAEEKQTPRKDEVCGSAGECWSPGFGRRGSGVAERLFSRRLGGPFEGIVLVLSPAQRFEDRAGHQPHLPSSIILAAGRWAAARQSRNQMDRRGAEAPRKSRHREKTRSVGLGGRVLVPGFRAQRKQSAQRGCSSRQCYSVKSCVFCEDFLAAIAINLPVLTASRGGSNALLTQRRGDAEENLQGLSPRLRVSASIEISMPSQAQRSSSRRLCASAVNLVAAMPGCVSAPRRSIQNRPTCPASASSTRSCALSRR